MMTKWRLSGLHRNFVWSLIASALAAASQWLVVAVLARWFAPDALGQYTYALAVVAPIVLLGQLNLRLMQTVDQRREYCINDFYLARAVGTVVSIVLLGLYLVLVQVAGASAALIVLVALIRFVEGFGDICHGQFLQVERADLQAISLGLRSALQLGAIVFVVVHHQDVVLMGVALLLAAIAAVFSFDLQRAMRLNRDQAHPLSRLDPSARRDRCVRILWRALPLGLMGVLGSLYQNVPRYELGISIGVEAVGYFSAVFYFTFIGYVVISAIGGAVSPMIARAYAAGRAAYASIILRVTLVSALVGLFGTGVAIAWGDWILAALYGASYGQFKELLVWVMVSSIFWYAATALAFCAIAAGKFREQAPAHVLAVLVTWWASRDLVALHGLVGAAMALTVGVLALLLAEVRIVWVLARRMPSQLP